MFDIDLPDIDGYEVARRIRAWSEAPAILIAVTGFGLAEDQIKSAAAGFDAHLVKPLDPKKLAELLLSYGDPRSPQIIRE